MSWYSVRTEKDELISLMLTTLDEAIEIAIAYAYTIAPCVIYDNDIKAVRYLPTRKDR